MLALRRARNSRDQKNRFVWPESHDQSQQQLSGCWLLASSGSLLRPLCFSPSLLLLCWDAASCFLSLSCLFPVFPVCFLLYLQLELLATPTQQGPFPPRPLESPPTCALTCALVWARPCASGLRVRRVRRACEASLRLFCPASFLRRVS